MPSMKCYECKKIARCKAMAERDENDKTVLVYRCVPCRRAWLEDLEAAQDGGMGGASAS